MALAFRYVPRIHRPAWAPLAPWLTDRRLLAAYLCGEGAGVPRDSLTGTPATPTNAPGWSAAPDGPSRQYVAGSTQYDSLGRLAALEGAQKVTIVFRCRRASATDRVSLVKGSATNQWLGVQLQTDGDAYFLCANGGGASYGQVATAGTDWHTLALVYDGSQTGNAARLRGYVDGVPKTLSFTNTIPAVATTSTGNLESGRNAPSATLSSGQAAGALVLLDALTPEEVARLSGSLAAALAPRRLWLPVGSPVVGPTATASAFMPEDNSEGQGYGGEVSVVWEPVDPLNAITDLTLSLNGVTLRDWTLGEGYGETTGVESIVDGKLRISGRGVAYADRANTVESTATTADAVENDATWDYTAARQRPASPGLVDSLTPATPASGALADYAVSAPPATPAQTDYLVAQLGLLGSVPAQVDYVVREKVGGIFQYTAAQTDYLLVDRVAALVLAMSADVGEFHQAVTPMTADVNGVSRTQAAAMAAAISGVSVSEVLAMAAEIGVDAHQLLVAMSAQLGEGGRADTPFAAQIEAVKRKLSLQYHAEPVAGRKAREEI